MKQTNEHMQELESQIKTGNLEEVAKLLKNNTQLAQQKDARERTALHIAVEKGQKAIVELLLSDDKTDINAVDLDRKTPLHLAVLQAHVDIVALLLKKGADAALKNNSGETVFHLAARSGRVDLLEVLLNPFGTYSPQLAELVNDNKGMFLFLDPNGTNTEAYLKLLANDEKTALHYAASQSNSEVVKRLLQYGAQVESYDKERNSPLHLAARYGFSDNVKLLVNSKGDLMAKNDKGFTPYWLALRFGHEALALWLKEQMPKLHPSYDLFSLTNADSIKKLNQADSLLMHDQVVDAKKLYLEVLNEAQQKKENVTEIVCLQKLAEPFLYENQSALLAKLAPIGIKTLQDADQYYQQGNTKEAEQRYAAVLLQAEETNNLSLQVLCLERTGNVFLSRKHYTIAAKIYNAALALYLKQLPEITLQKNPGFNSGPFLLDNRDVQFFYAKMAEVQQHYLTYELKINTVSTQRLIANIIKNRQLLLEMRSLLKAEINIPKYYVKGLLTRITDTAKQLLTEQIATNINILGNPPCQYAFIGFGSMSRNEMCPYSDLEYTILIEKETEENKQYFKNLARLLELQIINMGETDFPICNKGRESPTSTGFCLDPHGISPLGRKDPNSDKNVGEFELMTTPKKLARYQELKWFNEERVLCNALRNACFITGNKILFLEYENRVQQILAVKSKDDDEKKLVNRQERALMLMKPALEDFQSEVNQYAEHDRFFLVKKLYRFLSFMINYLTLFYDIRVKNGWEQLDALRIANKITEQSKIYLKQAMESILQLRLKVQLHYGSEYEAVWHPEIFLANNPQSASTSVGHFKLLATDVEQLISIYRTILPLHKSMEAFWNSKAKDDSLQTVVFFDESLITLARMYLEKFYNFEQARAYAQKAVAMNPNDIEALIWFGNVWDQLGDIQQAINYYEKALAVAKEMHGQNHTTVATALGNLSQAYLRTGNFKEALIYASMAVEIDINFYGQENSKIATHYSNLGNIWLQVGEIRNAIEKFSEALKTHSKIHGENHPMVATDFANLSIALEKVGDTEAAIQYQKKALEIEIHYYGNDDLHVAARLQYLGKKLCHLGKAEEAIDYLKQALVVIIKFHGEKHPDTAMIFNSLGEVWQKFGKDDHAFDCFTQALNILEGGSSSSDTPVARRTFFARMAKVLNNLGRVWHQRGDVRTAISYFERALEWDKKVGGPNDPDIAIELNQLGELWCELDDFKKALDYFEQAGAIDIHSRDLTNKARTFNNLGFIYKALGEFQKAKQYYEEALQLNTSLNNFMAMGTNLNNLGIFYEVCQNDPETAFNYYESASLLEAKHLGKPTKKTIKNLYQCGYTQFLKFSITGSNNEGMSLINCLTKTNTFFFIKFNPNPREQARIIEKISRSSPAELAYSSPLDLIVELALLAVRDSDSVKIAIAKLSAILSFVTPSLRSKIIDHLSNKVLITFTHQSITAEIVHLAGTFNQWLNNNQGRIDRDKSDWQMETNQQGEWYMTVALSPGKHEFKYIINYGDQWEQDRQQSKIDKEPFNSVIEVRTEEATLKSCLNEKFTKLLNEDAKNIMDLTPEGMPIEDLAEVFIHYTKLTEAFIRAAQVGNIDGSTHTTPSLQALLNKGVDVNVRDNGEYEATALHYAASNGDKAVVKFLLNAGADPTLSDTSGETALQWAEKGENPNEVVPLLKKNLAKKQKQEKKTTLVPRSHSRIATTHLTDANKHSFFKAKPLGSINSESEPLLKQQNRNKKSDIDNEVYDQDKQQTKKNNCCPCM